MNAQLTTPVLEVRGLHKTFIRKGFFRGPTFVHAVRGVDFSIAPKETVALVGESGCGKTTIARMLLGIETPTSGGMRFEGRDFDPLKTHDIQMIFQDPYGSLNPRKRAVDIIAEPLRVNTDLPREECTQRATEMMERVGLRPEFRSRYPHQFSGGQRQRIGIARALILKPKIVICDEPVSALDVSIQAQVLNLLMDLQDELGLSYLFISHDLSVVRHIADRILVMRSGEIVETGDRTKIFEAPQHDYTKLLLSSTLFIEG
jgi:dipeptide transport system ATP-binding protein